MSIKKNHDVKKADNSFLTMTVIDSPVLYVSGEDKNKHKLIKIENKNKNPWIL